MANGEENIISQLKDLATRLEDIAKAQALLERQIKMIFADITGFENMVMKVMDQYEGGTERFKDKIAH